MRVLILLVVALAIIFALVGWVTFSDAPGRASINIETNEIREDTSEVMQEGSELLQKAEERVAPDRSHEPPPPTE